MLLLYNFGIQLYYFLIIVYQLFNSKAKLWIDGRKNIFKKISTEVNPGSKSIWFHFASLGEFEQGRPVLELLKKLYPEEKIVITFFSPSGYELRKNYKHANHIFYLPLDTNKNAERFVKLINPKVAIFTKYEYWYHYFCELHKKNTPIVIISAIFRSNQPFFKWYGKLNRKILGFVNYFFVQDQKSKVLLESINISNAVVSGDTRFDRVIENSLNPAKFKEIENFCSNSKTFIAGSTWPQDDQLVTELVRKYPHWKFIIAPHEIREDKINTLISALGTDIAVKYSMIKSLKNDSARILIIDNIGMLSSLYQYGQIAYIGGGFGAGIHNTLEAAAFGMPVIFGPNYAKFREAKDLITAGAAFSIKDSTELDSVMAKLQDNATREKAGRAAKNYVEHENGATDKIIKYLEATLFQSN